MADEKPGGRDPAERPADTAEPTAPPEERAEPRPVTPLTQQIGRVAVLVIVVLFLVFAFSNLHYVQFDWIFGQTEVVERGGERVSGGVPLIVLLLVSFVLGAVVGAGLTWRRGRARRRQG